MATAASMKSWSSEQQFAGRCAQAACIAAAVEVVVVVVVVA
jgi:hypothetical protein